MTASNFLIAKKLNLTGKRNNNKHFLKVPKLLALVVGAPCCCNKQNRLSLSDERFISKRKTRVVSAEKCSLAACARLGGQLFWGSFSKAGTSTYCSEQKNRYGRANSQTSRNANGFWSQRRWPRWPTGRPALLKDATRTWSSLFFQEKNRLLWPRRNVQVCCNPGPLHEVYFPGVCFLTTRAGLSFVRNPCLR